jgi:CheY-like chemotaxis protein
MDDSSDKRRILVVDDDPADRLLLRKILGKENIIIEADSGESAVDVARMEKPDIILMDIMMPGVDGYTACRMIKEDPAIKAIPVVMISNLSHELNAKYGKVMGADAYITKPITSVDLLFTMEHLFAEQG